jgi:hypothetical protein
MRLRSRPWLLACTLLAGCANCEGDAPPPREPLVDDEDEADEPRKPVGLPPPEGAALDPEAMKPWTPDSIAGFTATGAAELRTISIANGGKLTSAHRDYKQGETEMRLEIRDTQHAPMLAQLVTGQMGQERKSGDSVFRGATVAGHPALLQWHGSTKTAMANVLVGDRVLVNVKLKPAADADATTPIITALPLADLVKLASTTQAEPGTPAPEAKPAPAVPPAGAETSPATKAP